MSFWLIAATVPRTQVVTQSLYYPMLHSKFTVTIVSYIISVILSFDIKCTSDTESKHTSSKAIIQHILKKHIKK